MTTLILAEVAISRRIGVVGIINDLLKENTFEFSLRIDYYWGFIN